jgi:pimeloyl-ACP methyl ester carboxylesterase
MTARATRDPTTAQVTAPRPPARPFEQGRYEDLPELPPVPHRYFDADTDDVVVSSKPFGRICVRVVSYGPADAPPLLLVHGLMTSSYSWRHLLEPLGDRFRLVAPDLPGAGRSEPAPDRRHDARSLATFVGELQAELGLHGCQAVANSLGGYICMRRALTDASAFERLVAIHPPGIVEPRLVALHAALRVPGVAAGLARVVRHDPPRWAHRNVHYRNETLKSLEEAYEYGNPLASAEGARAFTRYLGESLDPRGLHVFDRELERRRDSGDGFPIPLSLIYAREDPTVPPKIGPKLHALVPDAQLHWLERSSHFAQVDSPDRLATLLAAFLGR